MKPPSIEESFPLSPMQQGMLFHGIAAPQSTAYVRHVICALHEDLDRASFRLAWLRTVERHPTLRTSIRWKGLDAPLQDVHRQVRVPWDEQDWRGHSAGEQDARLEAYLAADRKRGFAFDEAPLMRLALFRMAEANYRFVWTFHHVVLDGRSRLFLTREVFAVYEAICRGDDRPQPRAPSCASYVEWLGQQDPGPMETFWRQALGGVAAPTPLVVDRTRVEGGREDDYGQQAVRLAQEPTAALLAMARANDLTPNTLLMGAWATLLARYSGEEDIVFGATRTVRRTIPGETEGIAGMFINTLPTRVRMPAGTTALAMLQALRAQWIAVRPHEHSPLAKVQEWSGVPAGGPLFESLVLFENYRLDSTLRAQGGAWERRHFAHRGVNHFPLTVTGSLDGALGVEIAYDRKRFDDAAIARMLGHLQTLLGALVADPGRCICDLPLLTEAERHRQLVEWNDTRRDYPTESCLHELFEQQAARTPDADAALFEHQCISYGELDRRANQLARHLQGLGVGPESLVGLYLERSLDMLVGLLGILKAGGAYVPLDAGYPQERIGFMLQDARIAVLVTRQRLAVNLPRDDLHVVRLDADWPAVALASDAGLPRCATPRNLAYVIYTSGSTGRPKGVLIEHRQILNYVQGIAERCRLEPGASFAMVQPLSVDSSQTVIFPALVSGGCLHVISEARAADAHALGETFDRFPVDLLKIAPSHLAALQLSAHPERVLPRRWLLIGGEVSRRDWVETLQAMSSCSLFNHYGPTEATVGALTLHVIGARDRDAPVTVPIGRPLPNVSAHVLDAHLQPAPIGIPGELHIGGRCLARGYLNRPELTAEKFIPDPFSDESGARLYRTGDLARRLPDGSIEFLGRIDDQVKIRGFRIEPGEVESVLRRHPGVRDCVVVAHADDRQPPRLVAYVVPNAPTPSATRDLRDFLKRQLPDYMVPTAFVPLGALPRTPHGKLDRRALPAAAHGTLAEGHVLVEPRNPDEAALARMWVGLLSLERIGVHDDFFDLGGHSLLAMQVISRVRDTFRVEIPLHSLFETPTIAGLAAAIAATR